MKVLVHCSRSGLSFFMPMAMCCVPSFRRDTKVLPGLALVVCAGIRKPVAVASTWPVTSAWMVEASLSKRCICALGASLVTSASWMAPRTTDTFLPFRSLKDLIGLLSLTMITLSWNAYGIEYQICSARCGVMDSVAITMSALPVTTNGMRFWLVTGTISISTPMCFAISLATATSMPSGCIEASIWPHGGLLVSIAT